MVVRLTNYGLTASSLFPDVSTGSDFFTNDLHDVIKLDALEDVTEDDGFVTDEENTVREDSFETFADMTGPPPTAASKRALCMQISFILHSD